MIIDFQQGIIAYPSVGNTQTFLARSGSYVNQSTTNGRVDITFAQGPENYFHTENENVQNAWGPLAANTDYWLYWDLDLRTAERTFGFTTIQPVAASSAPNGQEGLHWFNTATKRMNVFSNGYFRECLRVFAARVNNAIFTPLGSNLSKPFAGSQAGFTVANVYAGRILIDTTGKPFKRADGTFFTSESKFFFNGTPVNSVRMESGIVHATAEQNIAKFQVATMSDFGQIRVAQYEDLQSEAVALCMTSALTGEVAELCVQGMVTNAEWNWSQIGVPLWIDDAGDLTPADPHISDPVAHPIGRAPIARVFSPTSIYFDQGLGGKGDNGISTVTNVAPATTSSLGIVRISVPPTDNTQPIAVGTNDVRMTNARTPLPHVHAAADITTVAYKEVTGTTVDAQIHQLKDQIDAKSGAGVGALVELSDVSITNLQNKQVLAYDDTAAKWTNAQQPYAVIWRQMAPGSVWTITHNQNNSLYLIDAFDSDGRSLYTNGEVMSTDATDDNTITIQLYINTSGTARMVFLPPPIILTSPPARWLLDEFSDPDLSLLIDHIANTGHTWTMTQNSAPEGMILLNNWMVKPTATQDPVHSGQVSFFYSSCVVNPENALNGFYVSFFMQQNQDQNSAQGYIEFYKGLTFAPDTLLFRVGNDGTVSTPTASGTFNVDFTNGTFIKALYTPDSTFYELFITADNSFSYVPVHETVDATTFVFNDVIGIKMFDNGVDIQGMQITELQYNEVGQLS